MTQPEPTILVDVVDGVATITLNRPDRLNAVTPEMSELYYASLRAADADPEVRAIIVTGAGRGFCSGADLSVLGEGPDALNAFVDGMDIDSLPGLALRLGTPVVTAINGPCAGIGFVMAIAADARFVKADTSMSSTFSRLGLIAEYGVAWLLTRLVGLSTATDLLLTGRTISGTEAAALGLVNAAVDDPLASARAWAHDVASSCSPTSLAIIKRQLLDADSQDLEAASRVSLVEMAASFRRSDLAEALAARSEKRAPRFAPREG